MRGLLGMFARILFCGAVVWSILGAGCCREPSGQPASGDRGTEPRAPRVGAREKGGVLWTFANPDKRCFHGCPAISEGRVYVTSADGVLFCLDAITGDKRWHFEAPHGPRFSGISRYPCVSDGRVYVGSSGGQVHCLSAARGKNLWSIHMGPPSDCSPIPCVSEGRVYVTIEDLRLYCLDAAKGKPLWSVEVGRGGRGSGNFPCVVENRVYIVSGSGTLCCLDAVSGSTLWELEPDSKQDRYSVPVAAGDGRVYATFGSMLLAADAKMGKKLWAVDAGGGRFFSPSYSGQRVYAGNYFSGASGGERESSLQCLDAKVGAKLWEFKVDAPIASPPCVSDGRVYFGTDWGGPTSALYCLDAEKGTELWAFKTDYAIETSPSVWNGRVYFGCHDGNVYCLWTGDPDAGGWQMFGGGPEHGNYNRLERTGSQPSSEQKRPR
ncbi:MAG: hypothetical protein FJ279_20540 [Planctomycetes bacterium]|nr:hypothetical protein [Planctomycetota bacterium]